MGKILIIIGILLVAFSSKDRVPNYYLARADIMNYKNSSQYFICLAIRAKDRTEANLIWKKILSSPRYKGGTITGDFLFKLDFESVFTINDFPLNKDSKLSNP